MNKTLKFQPQFVKAIHKLDKVTTTRLFDDKDLSVGDVVDFLNSETGEKFATGKIVKIDKTDFAEMAKDAEDPQGLYKMYKDYYHREIKPEDEVKRIHFEWT